MSQIGLHLRLSNSFSVLAHQAIELEIPFFQSFLMTSDPILGYQVPSDRDVTHFRKICGNQFSQLYAHGSFWLNLADPARSSHDGLWHEMLLAQRLGFTHFVVHPGSSVNSSKQEGIEMVARTLNKIFSKESSIQLVLENTAHSNRAVGSSLEDLQAIRALLDKPEKVLFCIDTAHAHVYGYEISSVQDMQAFFMQVDQVLGINSIALLHLNDACEPVGSFKDRHAVVGLGTVGELALKKAYALYSERNIPIIVEPPIMELNELYALHKTVKGW